MLRTVVVGGGGHAKAVIDALLASGVPVSGVVDDNPDLFGHDIVSVPVVGGTQTIDESVSALVHAIGSNSVRRDMAERLGDSWLTVIHPSAAVSSFAVIGRGVVVLAQAVVQAAVDIGEGTIVNNGAVIEHDVVIGTFAHVASNATVAGDAVVGNLVLVGAGAVVMPGVDVGDEAVIGSGAVVTSDVKRGETVVGVPARSIGQR